MNLPEDDVLENITRLSDRVESVIDSNGQFAQSSIEDSMDEPVQDVVRGGDGTSIR